MRLTDTTTLNLETDSIWPLCYNLTKHIAALAHMPGGLAAVFHRLTLPAACGRSVGIAVHTKPNGCECSSAVDRKPSKLHVRSCYCFISFTSLVLALGPPGFSTEHAFSEPSRTVIFVAAMVSAPPRVGGLAMMPSVFDAMIRTNSLDSRELQPTGTWPTVKVDGTRRETTMMKFIFVFTRLGDSVRGLSGKILLPDPF